jgi:hypothetical protein
LYVVATLLIIFVIYLLDVLCNEFFFNIPIIDDITSILFQRIISFNYEIQAKILGVPLAAKFVSVKVDVLKAIDRRSFFHIKFHRKASKT